MNEIQDLVRNECANYCGKFNTREHYCCYEPTPDFKCVLFRTDNALPRCKYFEESVLPLDPATEAIYRTERMDNIKLSKNERESIRNRFKSTCVICGKQFKPTSNRQRFCPGCRKQAARERDARYRKRIAQGYRSDV